MKWIETNHSKNLPPKDGIYITVDKDNEVTKFYFSDACPVKWEWLRGNNRTGNMVGDNGHIVKWLDETESPLLYSLEDRNFIVRELHSIATWQLPESGSFYDAKKTQPMPYEVAWGSNGARDVMKRRAQELITFIASKPSLHPKFSRSDCEKKLLLIFRDDVLPHRIKQLVDYCENIYNSKK